MRAALAGLLLLIAATPVCAAPTILECTINGSKSNSNPNSNTPVSETLEVQVNEDHPEKFMTLNGLSANFVVASSTLPFSSSKTVGQNRSTKDVWDMESKHTGKYTGTDYVQDTAMRINRRTGAISASNHTQFADGFWTKFDATGNCVAQSATRKF